jgi:hypothetical protein
MRFSFVPQLSEHFEHLAFKGVVRACDANFSGELSEGGSV